jgi:hypothetical protein
MNKSSCSRDIGRDTATITSDREAKARALLLRRVSSTDVENTRSNKSAYGKPESDDRGSAAL